MTETCGLDWDRRSRGILGKLYCRDFSVEEGGREGGRDWGGVWSVCTDNQVLHLHLLPNTIPRIVAWVEEGGRGWRTSR